MEDSLNLGEVVQAESRNRKAQKQSSMIVPRQIDKKGVLHPVQ